MAYEWLVILGSLTQLIGAVSYVKETVYGKTNPNRVTWLMWAVAPMIATFAALSDGVTWPVLPVFMSGFGPLLVFTSSFFNRKAYWKLGYFDYLCGIFSIISLALWGITHEPDIAIAFAIASDGFAAIPTLIKMWRHPETENIHPFIAGLFSALAGFLVIGKWSFSSYAFPVYLVTVNILFVAAFYRRKIMVKHPMQSPLSTRS